jgi:hypothetical protein
MTNPIVPGVGAPAPRVTSDAKPKTTNAIGSTFTVPSSDDSVTTRGTLSFGSLAPLVKTDLNSDAAIITAQQMEKLLEKETLPLVNNRPQVVNSLVDAMLDETKKG